MSTPAKTRLERIADAVAKELLAATLAYVAREQRCRVRDLDPVFCAGLDVELQRKTRLHLRIAVEIDSERNTPMPPERVVRADQAYRDRMTRYHAPGDRYTPLRPIDPVDIEASRSEETTPGWRLPDGVLRPSRRATPVKS